MNGPDYEKWSLDDLECLIHKLQQIVKRKQRSQDGICSACGNKLETKEHLICKACCERFNLAPL